MQRTRPPSPTQQSEGNLHPWTPREYHRSGSPQTTKAGPMSDLSSHYYVDLAAAFVRGRLPDAPDLSPDQLIAFGTRAGLRLHPFRRTQDLPRVRKVLGILRGLGPADLL